VSTSNPHRIREGATDIIMILATQGIQACMAADPADPDLGQQLAAKLELAFLALGVSYPEMQASTVRVRAIAASVALDDEFEALMRGEFPGSDL
jgi:hypothetical protein